ncbi:hypothetical protein BC940DRAFT_311985 [Gongronella butleri]|nr:hypothetical protein BC940DRAFT_311985 [Gongronella butleri]
MERDRSRILVFNCTRMLNFSSGDAILPTRITCYCRHHNEKIGFRIEFVLHDHQGTIVATGSSPPIMITDDHKSSRQRDETPTLARKRGRSEDDLPGAYHAAGSTIPPDTPASSRRNSLSSSTNVRSSMSSSSSSSSSSSHLAADAAAIAEQPTPSTSLTSSPQQVLLGSELAMTPMDELSFLQQMNDTSSPLAMTQLLQQQQQQQQQQHHQLQQQHQYQQHQQQQPPSALPIHPTAVMEDQELWPANRRRRIAGNNTATNNGYDAPPLWRTEYTPQLERLVPAQGPTYGGIEITVLGTGFYRGLTCLFGEHAANTVYWNPNTLVCVLPPAATPGPVVVSFKEHPIVLEGQDVALFTYYDASDQALLELALQVVGIKMTGKLMDAKQIAMMIVRGDQQRIQQQQQQQQQQQSQNQQQNQQNQQQLQSLQTQELADASDDALTDDDEDYEYDYDSDASSVASSDVQDFSLENDEHLSGAQLEKHVMDALLASDCVDVTQTNTKGHTLLHLAVLLQFGALVKVLLARMTPGVIDRADRNGCTALQFACLQNNAPMVSLLLQAGASIGHDCSIGGTMDLATDPAVRAILEQHQRQRPMPLSRNVSFKSHVRRFYRLKSSDTRTSTTNDDQQALDDTGLGFAQAKFDRRLYAFWLPLLIVTIGFLYYQILGDRTLMNLLQDIIPFRQRGLTSIVGY